MTRTRQLHLGAFMRPVSIHTGAWRYPGAWPDANFNLAHLRRLIQTLEAAKFDAFFMADHLAVLNMPIEALKRSHRSEEHTSELQSLMRISYAVFCLKKKKQYKKKHNKKQLQADHSRKNTTESD